MSFVDNLRGVRKNHYLSQEKLTELLNVSRQALSKWEQGVMLE
ncbi:helix-turn-helix domain-containing protein [Thomasclavelia spiroformis]